MSKTICFIYIFYEISNRVRLSKIREKTSQMGNTETKIIMELGPLK